MYSQLSSLFDEYGCWDQKYGTTAENFHNPVKPCTAWT